MFAGGSLETMRNSLRIGVSPYVVRLRMDEEGEDEKES